MKSFGFDKKITKVCSCGSNWQYPSIGLDNGLAPNRRQAIIWTNADPIHWRIYATLGGELIVKQTQRVIEHINQKEQWLLS